MLPGGVKLLTLANIKSAVGWMDEGEVSPWLHTALSTTHDDDNVVEEEDNPHPVWPTSPLSHI